MKISSASVAGLAIAALLLPGCLGTSSAGSNHWRIESIGPRISYHFFGYDGIRDGSSWDYFKHESAAVGKTLERRLLNHNPDNPLTADL